ncbi:hypothetical protein [Nocardia sp. CY41]|uniref:hypothetical protein n=1 Tax=Nocardia sp. CY41 TaxID=2608686 RepID=UPI001F2418CB|nr:hypothetical protein [Nocardia sp. CY41]
MRRAAAAVARLGVGAVTGLACVAITGTGPVQAAPRDCVVEREIFSASATCPGGDVTEYVLRVECVGIYSSGPFPLYAAGTYIQLGYPFTPNGQRTTTGCMNWGPGLLGVVTNASVETYHR